MARGVLIEIVEEIKSRVLDSQCLARDASIEKFKIELAMEETRKKIECSNNRMYVSKLRLLQIEARIETILAKGNKPTTQIQPEATVATY